MEPQKSYYVTDWLHKRALLTPNWIALQDATTGTEISYREWNAAANRTANFLGNLGVQRGDRIAIFATNSLEYLDVWMACGKIGAILQCLNWRLTVAELKPLLRDAAPVVVVYSGEFVDQINQLRASISGVRHYVAIDTLAAPIDIAFRARDESPTTLMERPDLHPDDPWVICYTGGTTGLPKGAILTHGNMTWNSINTVTSWGLEQGDVTILNAPLFHTGGLNVFTLPLIHIGGTSIVCKRFDCDQVFNLIEWSGVTLYFGVPTMFVSLQHHPRWSEVDFSRMKLVISGGAPCPMPVFERFWERGIDFKTGYGLTEAGPNTFWLPAEQVRSKPGAVGYPLFHVDAKVVRPDGVECLAGEHGELIIRGAHVTPGYWNNPQATAEAIQNGWLHTGDLAICDADGCFSIVGRIKDMIISGGENVYPAEIESVLHAHPAVADAAVIGVPDSKWGEVGRAILVLKAGCEVTPDELTRYLAAQLANYKVPKSFVVVEVLPLTGANKIDKRRLTELYGGIT
jgi:fatty-acyl-CoA synthase